MDFPKPHFLCKECDWMGTDVTNHYQTQHFKKSKIKCLQCDTCNEFENEETYMAHQVAKFHVWYNAKIIFIHDEK